MPDIAGTLLAPNDAREAIAAAGAYAAAIAAPVADAVAIVAADAVCPIIMFFRYSTPICVNPETTEDRMALPRFAIASLAVWVPLMRPTMELDADAPTASRESINMLFHSDWLRKRSSAAAASPSLYCLSSSARACNATSCTEFSWASYSSITASLFCRSSCKFAIGSIDARTATPCCSFFCSSANSLSRASWRFCPY